MKQEVGGPLKIRMLVLAAGMAGAATAQAQTIHRCTHGGTTYLSDRPWVAGTPAKLGSMGPATPRSRDLPTASYSPSVGKAPEHLGYLSPQCASLNDAIRTAPARGLGHREQADLRNEYRQKCD